MVATRRDWVDADKEIWIEKGELAKEPEIEPEKETDESEKID